ncbi:MAG TPA: hypothetical protein VHQ43_06320 [Solirubrobacterales bacterium]|jgi:hypothetical protein|nr:hypothetical protein [Solirubrobacterales bacterium]
MTPNVFVFSDPTAGQRHGYYDGWLGDGCFHYTGEGQRGDQELKSGNAAILSHKSEGRALRVFKGAWGTVTYLDEFEVDEMEPFYRTDAHETGNGPRREVIVFRLRPKNIEPGEPQSKLAAVLTGPKRTKVPIERRQTEKAYVAPSSEPYEAERREQKLVLELEEHLLRLDHEVFRQRILPPGEARPLFTDLYDATIGMLVEAKGTVERNAIRMAIGQLADYKRFVGDGQPNHLAVLLPSEPRSDLCELLISQKIDLIYRTEAGFEDSTGGALVGK